MVPCIMNNVFSIQLDETVFIWYYLHMLYMFRVLITHLQEQLLRIEVVGITTFKILHIFSMYSCYK
jgi:hypothetical protein